MADERPAKKRKLCDGEDHGEVEGGSATSNSPEILVDNADEGSEKGDVQSNSPGPEPESTGPDGETKPMSKNQLKKLRKRQEWEAGRDYRKAKRKQKTKEKKERKRAAWEEVRANGDEPVQPTSRRPRNPVRLPITFVIDCGFDDLMMEKEMISLGSQLTRAYSDNARSHYQAHLVVSSWGGKLKDRFDTVLRGQYRKWKGMQFMEEDFVEVAEKAKEWMAEPKDNKMAGVFAKYAVRKDQQDPPSPGKEPESTAQPEERRETHEPPPIATEASPDHKEDPASADHPESAQKSPDTTIVPSIPTPTATDPQSQQGEIIYLSSDSPYTLTTLQPHSTYIIGGLVDKNRHKGICHKIATEKGLRTAKLPISEFMEMQSRSVLATNHVNEIMLRWLECGDWGKAFMQVIPKRKGGKLRGEGEGEGGDGGDGEMEDGEEQQEAGNSAGEGHEGEKLDQIDDAMQAVEGH